MSDKWMDWQCPPSWAPETKKLGWINEATEEGQNFLKSQRGFGDWRKSMNILAGRGDVGDIAEYRSHLSTNRLKRNVREVVGTLADIRPIWGYYSENDAYKQMGDMFNKVSRALYLENFYDQSLKQVLQYASATCMGWMKPTYRRGMGGRGKGNIELLTYGAPCVLPVQLPSSNNWQEAYAVTLMDEMPVYMAHSMWPEFQDRLMPTSSKYWYAGDIRVAAKGNLMQRMFSPLFNRSAGSVLSDLFIPIRYTTIIDNSINTTGETVAMGQPGSPWYYEVPSLGNVIPDGTNSQGKQSTRPASPDDARLYPFRRLQISSQNCVMYDGPAFNWHGQLDLIGFCLDSWPWEAIGYSLMRDGYEIQESINELERGIMDKHRAMLDLPLGYDLNAVGPKEAREFDPMQPRSRIGFDGSMTDRPFAPVVPPEVYQVGAEVMGEIEHLEKTMDYQMALNDMMALAAAKGNVDDVEKMLEARGPIVKDMSRAIEMPLAMLGHQMKYLIMQYLPTSRIMSYVGVNGVAREVFDFQPNKVIPSHLPNEIPTSAVRDSGGNVVWHTLQNSRYSDSERARWMADNLRFQIVPHSVHDITQMTYRLTLLQMRQRDLPIDCRTIAEACDIPNFGTKPEGATVYDRYYNEQEDKILHALRVQAIAQTTGVDLGLTPPGAPGGGGRGGPSSSGNGSSDKGGRPPTAAAAPKLEHKGDGRPLVSESK